MRGPDALPVARPHCFNVAGVRDSNIAYAVQAIESHYGRQRVVPLQGGSYSFSLVVFFRRKGIRPNVISFPRSEIGLALDGGSYSSIVVRIYVACQGMVQNVPWAGITAKLSQSTGSKPQ